MNKTLKQWGLVDAKLCASQNSIAANQFLIADAKQDIEKLGAELEELRGKLANPDIEAAAQKLAACMDYPWDCMPEQGRNSMREHAKAIIIAALNPKPEAGSHDRLCPGCGAKGWTANCDQCIPY